MPHAQFYYFKSGIYVEDQTKRGKIIFDPSLSREEFISRARAHAKAYNHSAFRLVSTNGNVSRFISSLIKVKSHEIQQ